METVKSIIPIFLEIAFDFKQVFSFYAQQIFAFFMHYAEKCTNVLFTGIHFFSTNIKHANALFHTYFKRPSLQHTEQVILPISNSVHTTTLPDSASLKTYTGKYIQLLLDIYNELEDAIENDTIPLFFIVTVLLILVLGSAIFLLALLQ